MNNLISRLNAIEKYLEVVMCGVHGAGGTQWNLYKKTDSFTYFSTAAIKDQITCS